MVRRRSAAALARPPAGASPPARRGAGRSAERTRTRLLDAALALFALKGYDGVVLGDVTARAGLGTGTLYLHYRDKRALYEAVVERELARLVARWRGIADPALDPFEQVELMVVAFIDFFVTADTRTARLFLIEGPAVEGWLIDEIGRGIASLLAPKLDQPELTAHLVMGLALGAARWFLARPRGRSVRAEVLRRARACCRTVLEAAGPKTPRVTRRRKKTRKRNPS